MLRLLSLVALLLFCSLWAMPSESASDLLYSLCTEDDEDLSSATLTLIESYSGAYLNVAPIDDDTYENVHNANSGFGLHVGYDQKLYMTWQTGLRRIRQYGYVINQGTVDASFNFTSQGYTTKVFDGYVTAGLTGDCANNLYASNGQNAHYQQFNFAGNWAATTPNWIQYDTGNLGYNIRNKKFYTAWVEGDYPDATYQGAIPTLYVSSFDFTTGLTQTVYQPMFPYAIFWDGPVSDALEVSSDGTALYILVSYYFGVPYLSTEESCRRSDRSEPAGAANPETSSTKKSPSARNLGKNAYSLLRKRGTGPTIQQSLLTVDINTLTITNAVNVTGYCQGLTLKHNPCPRRPTREQEEEPAPADLAAAAATQTRSIPIPQSVRTLKDHISQLSALRPAEKAVRRASM